jgi:ATP-dependent Clp protease ATP-binding subunit ClpC
MGLFEFAKKLLTRWKEAEKARESLVNFTPRAQQVLALARAESDRLKHNYIGTEHVLLGLLALGQGVAVNVLGSLGLDLENARAKVEERCGSGPEKIAGHIPYTPRVKKALYLARREAKALNYTYIGTEHLLLGILREDNGLATIVLRDFSLDLKQLRIAILKELDPNFSSGGQ